MRRTARRTSSSTWRSRAPTAARSTPSSWRWRTSARTSTRTPRASRRCTTRRASARTSARPSTSSATSSRTRSSRSRRSSASATSKKNDNRPSRLMTSLRMDPCLLPSPHIPPSTHIQMTIADATVHVHPYSRCFRVTCPCCFTIATMPTPTLRDYTPVFKPDLVLHRNHLLQQCN